MHLDGRSGRTVPILDHHTTQPPDQHLQPMNTPGFGLRGRLLYTDFFIQSYSSSFNTACKCCIKRSMNNEAI